MLCLNNNNEESEKYCDVTFTLPINKITTTEKVENVSSTSITTPSHLCQSKEHNNK